LAKTPQHNSNFSSSPTIRKKETQSNLEAVLPESLSAIFGMSTDSVARNNKKSKTADFNEFAVKIAKSVGCSESKITRKSMKARTSGRTKSSISKSNILSFTEDAIGESLLEEENVSERRVNKLRHGYVVCVTSLTT
jgi:hypothetical protein